jgi:hypothetical protein
LLGSAGLRIATCDADDPTALRRAFLRELDLLQCRSEQEIATTLLVFPAALADFSEYLDFLDDAQGLLQQAGLEGELQLASFHPGYQFAGEAEDAASHYSNRSPYPLIHLLRESMVSRALQGYRDPQRIPLDNIRTLDALGKAVLEARWRALFSPDPCGSQSGLPPLLSQRGGGKMPVD